MFHPIQAPKPPGFQELRIANPRDVMPVIPTSFAPMRRRRRLRAHLPGTGFVLMNLGHPTAFYDQRSQAIEVARRVPGTEVYDGQSGDLVYKNPRAENPYFSAWPLPPPRKPTHPRRKHVLDDYPHPPKPWPRRKPTMPPRAPAPNPVMGPGPILSQGARAQRPPPPDTAPPGCWISGGRMVCGPVPPPPPITSRPIPPPPIPVRRYFPFKA